MTQQKELFEYRRLLTHVRRRNTIPARLWNGAPFPSEQAKNASDKTHHHPLAPHAQAPNRLMVRKGTRMGPGKAAEFRAQVEALIEHFKPVEARSNQWSQKWATPDTQKGGRS